MMRQGAHWWPSWRFYKRHYERLTDTLMPYDFHFPPQINVEYPSTGNGVWVSKFSQNSMGFAEDDPVKPYLEHKPNGWYGHINMAMNADERCEVLRSFGAKFYKTVEECEDIPKTLEQGYQRGKKYEQLLSKMDDDGYLKRWLEHGILDAD